MLRAMSIVTLLTISACQQKAEPSDAEIAEKEFRVLQQSGADYMTLCPSATKVAATYAVEGDNPEKISSWEKTKTSYCALARSRMEDDAKHEALINSAEDLIRLNREANARAEALIR